MIENINRVKIKTDPSAQRLVSFITEYDKGEYNSVLFYNFPTFHDEVTDRRVPIRVLYASQSHGIILFSCLDNTTLSRDLDKEIDGVLTLDKILHTKFLKSPLLSSGRRSHSVNQEIVAYLNDLSEDQDISRYNEEGINILKNKTQVFDFLTGQEGKAQLSEDQFLEIRSILGGAKTMVRSIERNIPEEDDSSKGYLIKEIENEIKIFDEEQKAAAYYILDGPQRIRGLAGSGKTIILAMKAAQIHLTNPDANIAYTYSTKTLHDTVKRLITRFYRQFAEGDPNWDKLNVFHMWGGFSIQGFYSKVCFENGITPISFSDAKSASRKRPFDYVCGELLKYPLKESFDYILMDEAQDFEPSFYRLCQRTVRKNRVVWAYDDFQNILQTNIQDEKKTFGKNAKGEYLIDFKEYEDPYTDTVLHVCYRNPNKIISTAFALGLGIYNDKVLQRLENNNHWSDLGFEVEEGDSKPGEKMVISRPVPESIQRKEELLSRIPESIKFQYYDSSSNECQAVVKNIKEDLMNNLVPEDICVISLDDSFARNYFSYIAELLFRSKIECFDLQRTHQNNIHYSLKDKVTLSTVYKAKGNESASIHIVGVDAVFRNKDDITYRNKLFTAITRSKAWVSITGTGEVCGLLEKELKLLKKNDFKLNFIMPKEDDIKMIRRDVEESSRNQKEVREALERLAKSTGQPIEELIKQFLPKD